MSANEPAIEALERARAELARRRDLDELLVRTQEGAARLSRQLLAQEATARREWSQPAVTAEGGAR